MVCKFVCSKLIKWLEISNLFQIFPIFFSWLILEMINLDDYHANSQNFHEFEKLIFFVETVLMDFLSLWILGKCALKNTCAKVRCCTISKLVAYESVIKLLIHHINEKLISYLWPKKASLTYFDQYISRLVITKA